MSFVSDCTECSLNQTRNLQEAIQMAVYPGKIVSVSVSPSTSVINWEKIALLL